MNSPTRPIVIDNRYVVGRRIGRGGMADVFLAHDRRDNRDVAVKILFNEYALDPNFVERFRREAQAAASLDHPNIVDVFDWGRHESTYYIAMEYVDGRTLADILRANRSLTSKQAAEIAGEVAAALGFAHAAGLVHRDIKPANILIGTNGSVKVADFGIARALNSATESQLTQVGAVMGTATYFSPEQAQGAQPDPRSDLYSLGIVMYEMLAGRPPFLGDNPVAIAYKQVHDYPTPLNQLVVDVPRPYEAIVAKLLTKDPDVRYSTADALREDLRRFRNGDVPIALQSAAASARQTNQHNIATTMQPATAGRPDQTMVGGPGGRGTRQPTGAQRRTAPPGYDKRDRARTGWYALAAFFALVALGIGGFLLYNALTEDGSEQVQNRVPNYIGQPVAEVIADLDQRRLTYSIEIEDNVQYGPGIVHRTSPEEGVLVQTGTAITLYVTPDERLATIPELVGQTEAQARATLDGLGFSNVVARTEAADGEPGTVIRSEPPRGTELSVTSAITLYLVAEPTSTTTPTVDNPSVIGDHIDTARATLTALGLEVDVQEADPPNSNWSAGMVMGQTPSRSQQSQVPAGSTITLIVARAPQVTSPPQTNPPQTNPPQTNPPQTNPPQTTAAPTTTAPPEATPPPATGG